MRPDHILLIGYGAPATEEDVLPYLRLMTEGRGIPEERLRMIAKNYELIGSASPYNDQVEDFRGHFVNELRSAGIDLPVFVGMKNWHPFLKEVLAEIYSKGLRHGVALPLTAYRAASAGAGYQKDLEAHLAGGETAGLHYRFIEGWYAQKPFIEAHADEISKVLEKVPSAERAGTPILFSFHALPIVCDRSNPVAGYPGEALAVSTLVAKRLGYVKWSVVYQSRPASAKTPWLGPDIAEEITRLAGQGEKRILVAPVGFLCDHAEILFDLDHQAKALVGLLFLKSY